MMLWWKKGCCIFLQQDLSTQALFKWLFLKSRPSQINFCGCPAMFYCAAFWLLAWHFLYMIFFYYSLAWSGTLNHCRACTPFLKTGNTGGSIQFQGLITSKDQFLGERKRGSPPLLPRTNSPSRVQYSKSVFCWVWTKPHFTEVCRNYFFCTFTIVLSWYFSKIRIQYFYCSYLASLEVQIWELPCFSWLPKSLLPSKF